MASLSESEDDVPQAPVTPLSNGHLPMPGAPKGTRAVSRQTLDGVIGGDDMETTPTELADILDRTGQAALGSHRVKKWHDEKTKLLRARPSGIPLTRCNTEHGTQLVHKSNVLMLIKPPHTLNNELVDQIMAQIRAFGIVKFSGTFNPNTSAQQSRYQRHYVEHHGKAFHGDLCRDMATTGQTIAMVVKFPGDDPISVGRALCTLLRSKYEKSIRENAVHCSDTVEASTREISIWFGPIVVQECL